MNRIIFGSIGALILLIIFLYFVGWINDHARKRGFNSKRRKSKAEIREKKLLG